MFETTDHCALFWSGGLDSTLLLAMLLEEKKSFDIIQFRDQWTRAQRKRVDALIETYNLKVFSYAPATLNVIGDGDQISIVREYAVQGGAIPLISDVIDGTKCIESLNERSNAPITWPLIVVGSRKDDAHYAGKAVHSERWMVGKTQFWAPLYDKNRDWVKSELKRRGWPSDEVSEQEDTGNLSLCTACLRTKDKVFCPKRGHDIQGVDWSPSANLKIFQSGARLRPPT